MKKKPRCSRAIFLTALAVLVLLAGCGQGSGSTSSTTPNVANHAQEPGTEKSPSQASDEELKVTFKVVLGNDPGKGNITVYGFEKWKEMVEQRSNGRIHIDLVGGPEAIPQFEQAEAVKNGIVDMAWLSASYYANYLPEALALSYNQLSWEEERENGGWDLLQKIHLEELGVHLLGIEPIHQYAVYTTKPVESMDDFKGLDIRVTSANLPFMQAIGANPIVMPFSEVYTALERGVIDGFVMPDVTMSEFGLQEVVKFIVHPPFLMVDKASIVNVGKWEKTPEDLREIMEQAAIDIYPLSLEAVQKKAQEESEIYKGLGIQTIEIEDREGYLDLAYQSSWDFFEGQSKYGKELRKLMTKESQ